LQTYCSEFFFSKKNSSKLKISHFNISRYTHASRYTHRYRLARELSKENFRGKHEFIYVPWEVGHIHRNSILIV